MGGQPSEMVLGPQGDGTTYYISPWRLQGRAVMIQDVWVADSGHTISKLDPTKPKEPSLCIHSLRIGDSLKSGTPKNSFDNDDVDNLELKLGLRSRPAAQSVC